MSSNLRDGLGQFQHRLSQGRPQLSGGVVSHLLSIGRNEVPNSEESVLMSQSLQRMLDSYQRTVRMSLATTDVHISRALPNMMVSYPNREYIADRLVPVVPVDKRFDQIFQMPVETMQTVADVIIAGQRARPNEMKYSINHTLNYNVKDYGLIDFVSKDEIANADPPLRPYDYSQRVLMNALMLAREVRVQAVVGATGNYGANVTTLSGANKWDTATGDPVSDILTAMEACFVRPNKLWMGGQVWPKFRTNPQVLKYILGRPSTKSGATPLVVDLQTVADAFELDEVVIGRGKINTAAEGATVVSSYMWGKQAGLAYVEDAPNPRESKAFADTFRFGPSTIQVQIIPELLHGVRGGDFVKLTHSDDEIIVGGANSGYIFDTVIS